MKYAAKTEVSSENSRAEIDRILSRYGATGFMYGYNATQASIGFEMHDRRIRFDITLPDRNARAFTQYRQGSYWRNRTPDAAAKQYEQAVRQRWRVLALMIKAKLEAVESGVTEFEEEFLAHIVLPDGSTVGHRLLPQIARAYETGDMPPLLPQLN